MGTSTDGNKFTIDTKGCCFLCLEGDLTEGVISYSFQRLAKYLHLDFKNVYNISFPMASSISALENSDIVVSICTKCSIEANKFIKLHKDLELIRKRTNTCIGRICDLMKDADQNPKRLQEYRQRMTVTANPLELIQASIAENLRKETIDKCSQVTVLSIGSIQIQPTTSVSIPALTPITVTPSSPARSELEISRVTSTTKTTIPVSQDKKEVVLVDLDDSDEEDSESVPIIKSVTGSVGGVFSNTQSYNQSSSFQQFGSSSTSTSSPGFTIQQPGSSFSALQNFTSDYNFNAPQSQVMLPEEPGTSLSPAAPVVNDYTLETPTDNSEWHQYSDGRYQCKICGKIFKRYNDTVMTVHMRMHAGVKPLPCEHCNQQFRSTGNRRIHVLTYHRTEVFAQFHYPAVPKVTFQNVIDTVFKSVQRTSDTDRSHKCPYCVKQYRHRIDVEAHMIGIHFNEIGSKLMEMQRQGVGGDASYSSIHADDPQQVLPATEKKISCENCGLKFRYASSLTKHISNGCTGSKTGTKAQGQNSPPKNSTFIVKWKCGVCSSTFGSQTDLKKHKASKHGNNLKGGLSTETAVATVYKCTYCVKKFRFYHSQRVHMLTLHRYQVFSKYVPDGTSTDTLDRAVQNILENCKITQGNNHVCKFCSRDFAGSVESILQNHILVNHFQEVVNRLKNAVEEASQVESTGTSVVVEDQDVTFKEEVEAVLPD